jgi:hypothetical protein
MILNLVTRTTSTIVSAVPDCYRGMKSGKNGVGQFMKYWICHERP